MKKVISRVLSLVLTVSMTGAFGISASAESEIKFNKTFTEATDINEFTLVGEGSLAAKPSVAHNAEAGTMDFTGWGSVSAFLLPERINEKNYVLEADYKYSFTDEYTNGAIWLGFVFGYQDVSNFSAIRYRVSDGTLTMINANDGFSNSRYAEKGRGASIVTDVNTIVKLKMIVNEGKMEFFVNGELCYTYYSPDDSRLAENSSTNSAANNFTSGGRLGLYTMGDKARISVDAVRVRTVGSEEVAFHSDAYNDPNMAIGFKTLNGLDEYFATNKFDKGNWGESTWQANGYSTIGQYSTTSVSGDYTVDLNFAYNKPFNASRYVGIAFGIKEDDNGGLSYNVAGVRTDGSQFIEQAVIVNGSSEKIENSKYAYGNCRKVLPAAKQNPNYDGETDEYFINYHPDGESAPTAAAELAAYKNERRNTMRLSVVDGVAKLSFGGSTITCDIDVNSTDGYVAIISAGSAAKVYSFRSAPYYVDEPIKEIKTTMEFDYIDIGDDYTDADVIIDDKLSLIDQNTKLIVAAYKNGVLLGTNITAAKNGLNMPSIEYNQVDSTDGITLRAYLWDITNQKPIIESIETE